MSLETPEGSSWTYFVTRIPSILRFSAEYCSRIAVCEGRNTAHNYVLWNVHTTLFIYKSHLNDRVSVCLSLVAPLQKMHC